MRFDARRPYGRREWTTNTYIHSARRVLGPVLGGGLRRGMECPGHEVNDIDHGDHSRTKRAVEMSGKVDFLMTPPPSS